MSLRAFKISVLYRFTVACAYKHCFVLLQLNTKFITSEIWIVSIRPRSYLQTQLQLKFCLGESAKQLQPWWTQTKKLRVQLQTLVERERACLLFIVGEEGKEAVHHTQPSCKEWKHSQPRLWSGGRGCRCDFGPCPSCEATECVV